MMTVEVEVKVRRQTGTERREEGSNRRERNMRKKKAAVVWLFWANFYCSGSSGDNRVFGATEEETGQRRDAQIGTNKRIPDDNERGKINQFVIETRNWAVRQEAKLTQTGYKMSRKEEKYKAGLAN
jgi:hypothetical protein